MLMVWYYCCHIKRVARSRFPPAGLNTSLSGPLRIPDEGSILLQQCRCASDHFNTINSVCADLGHHVPGSKWLELVTPYIYFRRAGHSYKCICKKSFA